jgi:hypothetical protein
VVTAAHCVQVGELTIEPWATAQLYSHYSLYSVLLLLNATKVVVILFLFGGFCFELLLSANFGATVRVAV